MIARDATFSDDAIVQQHHGDAPVVEVVEAIVGVDIGQLRLEAKLSEEAESLVAQVTVLTADEDQAHARSLRALAG